MNVIVLMFLYPLLVLPNWVHIYIFRIIYILLPKINPRVITRIKFKLHLTPSVKCSPKLILSQTYFNVIAMLRFTTKFKKVNVERDTVNAFQEMASDTQHHVVFGIHSGAFELMHMSLSNDIKPTYVLTASLGKRIDPIVLSLRKQPNTFYIQPEEYSKYHKKILSEPCIVALLIDQSKADIKNCATIDDLRVPLFSQLVHTLYHKNFKVSSIESHAENSMNHRVSIGKSLESDSNQTLDDFIESEVKRMINSNPTQWVWHYPIRESF